MSSAVLKPAAIRSTERVCYICQEAEDTRPLWAHEDIRNNPDNNNLIDWDDLNRPWTPPPMFHPIHKECQKKNFESSPNSTCGCCRVSLDLSVMFPLEEKIQKAALATLQQGTRSLMSIYTHEIMIATIFSITEKTPEVIVDCIACRILNLLPTASLRNCWHRTLVHPMYDSIVKLLVGYSTSWLSGKLSNILFKKIIGRNDTIQNNKYLNDFYTMLSLPDCREYLFKNPDYRTLQIIFLQAIGQGITSLCLGRT